MIALIEIIILSKYQKELLFGIILLKQSAKFIFGKPSILFVSFVHYFLYVALVAVVMEVISNKSSFIA